METTVGRYVTESGGIPLPPDPAYAIIEDGVVRANLTADQMDAMFSLKGDR